MSPSDRAAVTAERELERAFGEPVAAVGARNWPELARRLREHLGQPDREPVESHAAIERALRERWGMPVVETGRPVGSMGPLAEADPDYGRCGVRLLDLFGQTRVYVVIRRRGKSRGRLLWALLHELGHFVNHFEILLSLSTLYHRICMNPSLEMEVGRFARGGALRLQQRHELEADLFAIDWLLPAWMDDDAAVLERAGLPAGLSADGYRLFRLRRALDDLPLELPLEREGAELLNRAAADERGRSSCPYPHDGQLWRRATWMLFNRRAVRDESEDDRRMRREYFEIAGYPPRRVPELTRRSGAGAAFDPELSWLPRAGAEEAVDGVDGIHWSPLLVPGAGGGTPSYYIPVRPVPARSEQDSAVRWTHMLSQDLARPPLPVREWIERAQAQRAGLLLFPRNPAERALDGRGEVRA